MRIYRKGILLLVLILAFACKAKQNGALEGAIAPPNSGATITVMQSGKSVSAVTANAQDGKFRAVLAPGSYDVSVTAPLAPFPMSFPGIIIEPDKTTVLPLIEFAPSSGAAALTGTITPGGSGARVVLLYEGKERAGIAAGPEGKYEFTGLPSGHYTVKAEAPGYAGDSMEVNLGADQKASRNVSLLYITSVDGVDWAGGKIRAKGMGLPPAKGPNQTIRHELAKRAALVDAQRNLLKILDQLKVDRDHNLKSYLGEKKYTEKIQGFVRGYSIVAERELENGAVEVDVELPLTGLNGLSKFIFE